MARRKDASIKQILLIRHLQVRKISSKAKKTIFHFSTDFLGDPDKQGEEKSDDDDCVDNGTLNFFQIEWIIFYLRLRTTIFGY